MHYTTRTFFAFTALATLPALATAGGVGEIITPFVKKDQYEIQYHMTATEDDNKKKDGKYVHRLETEYAFGEDWLLEIGFKFEDKPGTDLDLKAIYPEAKYAVTKQKDGYWLTSALLGEYVFDTDGGNDKVEVKWLMQRDQEHFKHRSNITLEREVGSGAKNDIKLNTRHYSLWKVHKNINPAIEWHADWGALDHFEDAGDQKHWVGPGFHGELFKFPDGSKLKYQTSYNFGLTDASEDHVARVMLEFKKQF